MMRFYFIVLLYVLCNVVLAQKGTLEDESIIYNLEVTNIAINVAVLDADEKKPLKSSILVRDLATKQAIHSSQPNDGVAGFVLRKNKVYNLTISAPKHQDSVIVLNMSKDVSVRQIILLNAKRITYEINISDMETGSGLPFGITLTNRNRNEVIEINPSDGQNGRYKVKIREDDEYELEVKNPQEYIFYSNTISSKKAKKLEVKLHTLSVGAKIPLYNITFESGAWDLNNNSVRELNRIIKLLKDNPKARIEIAAHTDSKGSAKNNLVLSQKRAKTVFTYLVTKKIPASRFVAQGYGQEKPIADNQTEEGRATNRRFELKVMSL